MVYAILMLLIIECVSKYKMKNNNDKPLSISDLVNEFQISKESIELYGIHKLIQSKPSNTKEQNYRLFDKVRLKFITRAHNADYRIGQIKTLLGVLNLEQNEADQIEESLVYSKKKYAALKESLKDIDVLEKINITCDLELLDSYINDLTNLKYGLNDILSAKIPPAEFHTVDTKPNRMLSKDTESKKSIINQVSQKLVFVGIGVVFLALSIYIYVDYNRNLSATNINPLATESHHVEQAPNLMPSIEKGTEDLPESVDIDQNEIVTTLASDLEFKAGNQSLIDAPAFENESQALVPKMANGKTDTHVNHQQHSGTDIKTSASDIKAESHEFDLEPTILEKDDKEKEFFKQLVADLQKKYDKKANNPTLATGDIKHDVSTPQKDNQTMGNNDLALLPVTNATQSTNQKTVNKLKTSTKFNKTLVKKLSDKPNQQETASKKKTSRKAITLSSPKEIEPTVFSQTPIPQRADKPSAGKDRQLSTVQNSETVPPAIEPTSPTKKTAKSTQKEESPLLSKLDESANRTIIRPKQGQKKKPPKPVNPEALKWIQKSYESLMNGNNSEAIIAASVAITLEPGLAKPYINRAWAYSNKGQYDKAIADCNIAIKKDPKSMLAYNNRGVAYQGKGDSEKAKADYQKACSLGLELACKNYKEIVSAETVDRLLKQSLTHFSQKQWDDVIASASKALKLSPNNVTAHANRSAAYIQKGLYEMALQDCNKAIEIKPDYALAYNNRGSALELLGRKEEAALDYIKSCSLGFNLGCQNAEKLEVTP